MHVLHNVNQLNLFGKVHIYPNYAWLNTRTQHRRDMHEFEPTFSRGRDMPQLATKPRPSWPLHQSEWATGQLQPVVGSKGSDSPWNRTLIITLFLIEEQFTKLYRYIVDFTIKYHSIFNASRCRIECKLSTIN